MKNRNSHKQRLCLAWMVRGLGSDPSSSFVSTFPRLPSPILSWAQPPGMGVWAPGSPLSPGNTHPCSEPQRQCRSRRHCPFADPGPMPECPCDPRCHTGKATPSLFIYCKDWSLGEQLCRASCWAGVWESMYF